MANGGQKILFVDEEGNPIEAGNENVLYVDVEGNEIPQEKAGDFLRSGKYLDARDLFSDAKAAKASKAPMAPIAVPAKAPASRPVAQSSPKKLDAKVSKPAEVVAKKESKPIDVKSEAKTSKTKVTETKSEKKKPVEPAPKAKVPEPVKKVEKQPEKKLASGSENPFAQKVFEIQNLIEQTKNSSPSDLLSSATQLMPPQNDNQLNVKTHHDLVKELSFSNFMDKLKSAQDDNDMKARHTAFQRENQQSMMNAFSYEAAKPAAATTSYSNYEAPLQQYFYESAQPATSYTNFNAPKETISYSNFDAPIKSQVYEAAKSSVLNNADPKPAEPAEKKLSKAEEARNNILNNYYMHSTNALGEPGYYSRSSQAELMRNVNFEKLDSVVKAQDRSDYTFPSVNLTYPGTHVFDPFNSELFKDEIVEIDYGAVDAFSHLLRTQYDQSYPAYGQKTDKGFATNVVNANYGTLIEKQLRLGDALTHLNNEPALAYSSFDDYKRYYDGKHGSSVNVIDVNTNAYSSQEYGQHLKPSLVIENVPADLKGNITVEDLNRAFSQALKAGVDKPDIMNHLKTIVKTKQLNAGQPASYAY